MSRTDTILKRLLELHPNKLIDLKLDRVERLLEAMGRPQDRLPPVIHVAGTNGKGSTIAHLRAFLEAGGHRVHVYTSPHLVHFNERIRLAGKLVSARRLNKALSICEELNAGLPITYFEITTAAAILLFSQIRADYLLLEVGLGGRFDTTNVIDHPLGVVITPVSIDHTEFLGNDLATIAKEKSGILKAGSPAVIGQQCDEARNSIEAEAQKLRVEPKYADQDFQGYIERGRMTYQDETGLLDLPLSNLKGAFQTQNAALAIAAIRYFGLPVSQQQIALGLKQVDWPGRLMPLKTGALVKYLGKNQQLWLDGGHNEAGGRVLAQALADLKAQDNRPLTLITGAYANKDLKGYFSHFIGLADEIITIPLNDTRLSWSADELATLAQKLGFISEAKPTLKTALNAACKSKNTRIVICGSLHLAGEVLFQNKTPPE